MNIKEIILKMSLTDKIAFLSGEGMWRLKSIDGLPSLRLADGPNGLRKIEDDDGLIRTDEKSAVKNQTIKPFKEAQKATMFPTLSALCQSWDRNLVFNVGHALAKEATGVGVHVVLAPSVNIKRNALGGRNFEYFSEDPYLAGEMGLSYVKGAQLNGLGACVKHFAANNREDRRMTYSSYVDERALREIYLYPFEQIVKEAKPKAIMTAYNKLNGEYCSSNIRLIKDILRGEWGFDGVVMSDWGGTYDRVKALKAGLDLEMPSSNGSFDEELLASVKNGEIDIEAVDKAVERLLKLIDDCYVEACGEVNLDDQNKLCVAAAESCAVLLKNDGMLPLKRPTVLLGSQGFKPVCQGGGSAAVNPREFLSPADALAMLKARVSNAIAASSNFRLGLSVERDEQQLLSETLAECATYKNVVLFAADIVSEGYDLGSLSMGDALSRLITALKSAGHRVCVVLSTGNPAQMPWAEYADAIVQSGLSGQGFGEAIINLLFGLSNFGGKLSESYPYLSADNVNTPFFESGIDGDIIRYAESIYVGYRYYDKIGLDVRFPFGHGLSYTTFEYSDLLVKKLSDYDYSVTVNVTNTGVRAGAEVIQLYVGGNSGGAFRAEKELKGFEKIYLKPDERATVTMPLNFRSFAYYDVKSHDFKVAEGEYKVAVGASSRDIRLSKTIMLNGGKTPLGATNWYNTCKGQLTKDDFDKLYSMKLEDGRFAGEEIKSAAKQKKGSFTLLSTPEDLRSTFVGKVLIKNIKKIASADKANGDMIVNSSMHMPLRSLSAMSEGALKIGLVEGLVDMANGKVFKGLKKVIKNRK